MLLHWHRTLLLAWSVSLRLRRNGTLLRCDALLRCRSAALLSHRSAALLGCWCSTLLHCWCSALLRCRCAALLSHRSAALLGRWCSTLLHCWCSTLLSGWGAALPRVVGVLCHGGSDFVGVLLFADDGRGRRSYGACVPYRLWPGEISRLAVIGVVELLLVLGGCLSYLTLLR